MIVAIVGLLVLLAYAKANWGSSHVFHSFWSIFWLLLVPVLIIASYFVVSRHNDTDEDE